MAASAIQTTVIPRFLLPRLTWSPTSVSPAISAGLFQAHRSRRFTSQCQPSARPTHPRSSKPAWTRGASLNCNTAVLPRPPSSSPILSSLSTRRAFASTPRQSRDHHFDTLKFVQRLQADGFTEDQAVAMMKVLSDVIEERCSFPTPPTLQPTTDTSTASKT